MRRVLAFVLASSLVAPAFAGPNKATCVAEYEETQKLKKSGKLLEAKKHALICAADGCPAAVRNDCTSWSADLDQTIPTIVLVVTDSDGKDVTDAVAYIDGEKVTSHVEGNAISLDPGKHKLRVEREGYDTIEQDVVAHEGDKNRSVSVKFPKKGGDEKPVAPPTAEAPPAAAPIPASAWVFGAVGVVGIAGFAVFGSMGSSKKSELDSSGCKPACRADDVSAVKRDFLIADIALGVGVVSLGVATVLILTRGEEPKASTPAVGFNVSRYGASGAVTFAF
jgi:hypothetical protein